MIVTKDTKLHDVVINEPAIIAVLSRFGITLGIGDNTVRRICDERGINASFFVATLNAFIDDEKITKKTSRQSNFCINFLH